MSRRVWSWMAACVVVVAALAGFNSLATPVEAKSGCPRDINCPDIYDPVTCDFGQVFPNACYAFRACATGCSAGGS